MIVENDKTPMAVGSTFKLLVLKAYEDAIKRRIKRETIVSLKEKIAHYQQEFYKTYLLVHL